MKDVTTRTYLAISNTLGHQDADVLRATTGTRMTSVFRNVNAVSIEPLRLRRRPYWLTILQVNYVILVHFTF